MQFARGSEILLPPGNETLSSNSAPRTLLGLAPALRGRVRSMPPVGRNNGAILRAQWSVERRKNTASVREELKKMSRGGGTGSKVEEDHGLLKSGQCKTPKLWNRGGAQCRLIDETKGSRVAGERKTVLAAFCATGVQKRERGESVDEVAGQRGKGTGQENVVWSQ